MDIQWPLVLFSTLAGCGGVVFACAGLAGLRGIGEKTRVRAAVAAIVLLVVGGCASVFHLAQKANIMAAAANVFSFSGISVELIFLGINVVLAVVYVVMAVRSASEGVLKVVGAVGIVTGLIMAFVTGNGYVMESQQYWNTVTLPLAYLGSSMLSGAAVYGALMVSAGEEKDAVLFMAKVGMGAAVVDFCLLLAYGAATGFVLDAVWFWVVAVVLGAVGSFVALLLAKKNANALYVAAALSLIGAVGLRAAMFLVGYGFIESFALASARVILGV